MQDWKTPVLQLKSEETIVVICHAHNTYDKRKMFEQKNPSLKKMSIKLKYLLRDKACREFYMDLAKDYEELDSGAPTLEVLEATAEVLGAESIIIEPDNMSASKINLPAR